MLDNACLELLDNDRGGEENGVEDRGWHVVDDSADADAVVCIIDVTATTVVIVAAVLLLAEVD